jgi:hypothetical protein
MRPTLSVNAVVPQGLERALSAILQNKQSQGKAGPQVRGNSLLAVSQVGADRVVRGTVVFETEADLKEAVQALRRGGVRRNSAPRPAITWHMCGHDEGLPCTVPDDFVLVDGE